MKLFSQGFWRLESELDYRWDEIGDGIVGCNVIPPECQSIIDELTIELGEPPKDLKWSYMEVGDKYFGINK